MLQVGYQILKSLLPLRRMRFIVPVVSYALRRERDSLVQASVGSYQWHCRCIKRRTSCFECRVDGVRRQFLPFSELQLRFLSDRVSEDDLCLKQMTKESITEKSATFSFFFFVLFGIVEVADQERFDRFRLWALRPIHSHDRQNVVGWFMRKL